MTAADVSAPERDERGGQHRGDRHPGGGIRDDRRVVVRLLVGSFVMLFVELALIRWLGANVVHLSYFSNFVLLGSFLGIGCGFLISRKSWSIWPYSLPILTLLVVCVRAFPVTIERQGSDVIYFTSLAVTGPPAKVALPIVFIVVAAVLAGPAEIVGRCFGQLRPLSAYRYDLLGSLAGILTFSLLSFLRAPSFVWGVIAALGYVALAGTPLRRIVALASSAVMIGVLVVESSAAGVLWSPYYKLETKPLTTESGEPYPGYLTIYANGVPHQLMAPAEWKAEVAERIYHAPYERLPGNSLGDVLVIGAGSGSDVAIALREGARRVDAVDIDPEIMDIGKRENLDKPYDDPRVHRHVNDGRAFLESTDRTYDLVLFALPDSLTLVSGASQIRLESFLFTRQALESVREHLKPDGSFAMYNYYRETWLIDRLAGTVDDVFGHPPCVDTFAGNQAAVSVSMDADDQRCEVTWAAPENIIAPATDDRPFLYFQGGMIPGLYIVTLLGVLLVSLVAVRALGGPLRTMRPYADLFFMGTAFLLLETKNVATFALLFGTTWFVNALVFAGVLVVVLLAVETTRRLRTPPLSVVYGGVAASLILAWLVKPAYLLGLSFTPRLLVATLLAFLPIYLANVAFSKRFAASSDAQGAFAVNLLGAIVGGCLEYGALLVGYDNLLVVTGVLYLAAFLLLPRETRALGRAG